MSRVATRHDRLALDDIAFAQLPSIMIWLRALISPRFSIIVSGTSISSVPPTSSIETHRWHDAPQARFRRDADMIRTRRALDRFSACPLMDSALPSNGGAGRA